MSGESRRLDHEDERAACRADLRALHAEVDREVATLASRHVERLVCRRGCSACCLDDLSVTAVEADRIRRAHPRLLSEGEPHPTGACAFLDAEGACRIYADRPLVCRTQGVPMRVVYEDDRGELAERRDICELNEPGGPPVDRLEEEDVWLVGPYELRLSTLEERFSREDRVRFALRTLFTRR